MTQPTMDPADALAELGRVRLDEVSLDDVLLRIAELAKGSIPGTREVTVTLVRGRSVGPGRSPASWPVSWTSGSTSSTAAPALMPPPVVTPSRYRTWPPRGVGRSGQRGLAPPGVRSSLSIGLPIQGSVVGALNVYSDSANAFDPTSIASAEGFAAYAAVALANAHLYENAATLAAQMQEAMRNRAVIEQAKGIIMGSRRCSPEEAFALLSKISQDTNRKVREVAEALVAQAVGKSRG